ncbi:AAAP amino acid permease [Dacryopinax primogenitus]|uniref:AAAP amino acid permease n=1 Tax=Dacryopinax primogenitus (strain DJM 731) TaxID=1858805 RepID=M5G2F2_DACPD|nr:AAAP amino acid permease [Dacryopinax primogenitus]EJU04391.1 AAAP amino acid permease [Dacryopinax primogenitus]
MPLLLGLVDTSHDPRSLPEGINLDGGERGVDLEDLHRKKGGSGGLLDSIFNMANSILGAGIIGLPYAISEAGLVTGTILLIILGIVTDWTIRLIVRNAKLSGRNSYIDIMDHCFGKSGRAAVSFFQFSFAFGGMCAFGIIIGDTIPHVIASLFPSLRTIPVLYLLTKRRFVIALCTICISYPLSLYRDIAKLARASALALAGMLLILISVVVESIKVEEDSKLADLRGSDAARWTIIQPRIAEAIGVISFAFVCHHNSLLIYGSLSTPTMDRFDRVTHVATGVSIVACLVMGLSGFLTFTDRTQGNILNNFSQSDLLINIARLCFGMNMFTTLPLELFVCREVIEDYYFPHEPFSWQRHALFTTSILMASMFLALITCDLGVTLEITGGVSATALAFIFPAACYYKLLSPEQPWYGRHKLPAIVCASSGFIVMVMSLILALTKAWRPEGAARMCIE